MINTLCKMYLTMSPLICGGIANMIFTKTNVYKKLKYPIDMNKILKDGKRVFGENKTWVGFFSMIIFCAFFQVVLGFLCKYFDINHLNELYKNFSNTTMLNLIFGVLSGFVYMISELPNSFIKRRLNIGVGKTGKGFKGICFFVIDQIDSLIGVMFLLFLFSEISFEKYLLYIFVGAGTHLLINLLLFSLKVRKNI